MEKHKCKLCSKCFSNGKALGGHIRTHLTLLPIPSSSLQQVQPTEATSSLSSDEEQVGRESDEKILAYRLRENPRKSYRLVDPEFLDVGSLPSFVQDGESETEPIRMKTTRRKRSKRAQNGLQVVQAVKQQIIKNPTKPKLRKSSATESVAESVSSDTIICPEEEYVAWCLVMLSRDVWTGSDAKLRPSEKYKCEKCNKVFGSSLALSGHKTSHTRKLKENASNGENEEHLCSICGKSFRSGQALGGHKRSHFMVSSTNAASASASASANFNASFVSVSDSASAKPKIGDSCFMLDLNLPAPMEENEDISALSAVSDALFINPTCGR